MSALSYYQTTKAHVGLDAGANGSGSSHPDAQPSSSAAEGQLPQSSAPAFLLVHGFGAFGEQWRGQIKALTAAGYQVGISGSLFVSLAHAVLCCDSVVYCSLHSSPYPACIGHTHWEYIF